MSYLTYLIIISLLCVIPQILVQVTYNKYSKVKVKTEKTGEMIVEEMLTQNGVNDVYITKIPGMLTDHYDSRTKKIALSNENFSDSSIAGIAVAAHETGHAIQDHKGYFFLRLRHALGTPAIVASKLSWVVIYIGFIFLSSKFIWAGITLLAVVLLFQVVTLPVEINASRRAKKYLLSTGEYTQEEIAGASKVLLAAAFTYVAVVLAGVLQILRLVSIVKDD